MSKIPVEKIVTDKFCKIVEKHGNGKWALDELEYLIFEAYRGEFENLCEDDQWAVRHVIDAYKKIYG